MVFYFEIEEDIFYWCLKSTEFVIVLKKLSYIVLSTCKHIFLIYFTLNSMLNILF